MKVSKNLRSGDFCRWHGDKLVKASPGCKRIYGVWTEEKESRIVGDDGSVITVKMPKGVIIQGYAMIRGFP